MTTNFSILNSLKSDFDDTLHQQPLTLQQKAALATAVALSLLVISVVLSVAFAAYRLPPMVLLTPHVSLSLPLLICGSASVITLVGFVVSLVYYRKGARKPLNETLPSPRQPNPEPSVSRNQATVLAPTPPPIVVAPSTQKTRAPFVIPRSHKKPDPMFLQFLLNDAVGGGHGAPMDQMLGEFHAYEQHFLAQFPGHLEAVDKGLKAYTPLPDVHQPLETAAKEILDQLNQKKYLTMQGGYYDGEGDGHALFFEWILDETERVTLRITNSGEGLKYHPVDIHHHPYRTLVFSGATLSSLQQSYFLPLCLSCMRPRSPQGAKILLHPRMIKVESLYTILFQEWPGSRNIHYTNPGKAQRANSCSLICLLKWFKWQCDAGEHSWILLWIKLSAFSDYLDNETEPKSAFIADALAHLAVHLDKMETRGELSIEIKTAWKEISHRAHNTYHVASAREEHARRQAAFSANPGWGVEKYELVLPKQPEQQPQAAHASYVYPHTFPGQPPPLGELKQLTKKGIAPLVEEMADRMNLIRLLPECSAWKKGLPLASLGQLLQLFFYDGNPTASLHVPDAFCADLINLWMGLYLQAKQEKQIPNQVLLEWMRGMQVLVEFFTPELSFTTPGAKARWCGVAKQIRQELPQLRSRLEANYTPPDNYWQPWRADEGNYWSPFEKSGCSDFRDQPNYKKLSELPEMAQFEYSKLHTYLRSTKLNSQNASILDVAKKIEARYVPKNTAKSAMLAFLVTIHDPAPCYQQLKFGLAALFVLLDRHLFYDNPYPRHNTNRDDTERFGSGKTLTWPKGVFSHLLKTGNPPPYPTITSIANNTTRISAPKSKPESVVASVDEKFSKKQELNERIVGVIREEEREYPFMTFEEEKRWISFVHKAEATRFPELLAFFELRLEKLILPEYQALFKHFLFSIQGSDWLEQHPTFRPLLFDFFQHGYAILLKRGEYQQAAAAALFHAQLLLCAFFPEEATPGVIAAWNQLLKAGIKNPILGRALGEAVLAALPSLEPVYPKLMPALIDLLATTCVVGCLPGDYTKACYDPLDLQYGWHSCKALLARHPKAWHQAAERVFDKKEAEICIYDTHKEELKLKTMLLYLGTRTIQGGSEGSMQVIPSELRDYDFNTYFGKETLFAQVHQRGQKKVYAFVWKGACYELRTGVASEAKLYKMWRATWYALEPHWFVGTSNFCPGTGFHTWSSQEGCLLEHRQSHEPAAYATQKDGIRRYQTEGTLGEERLALFKNSEDTPLKRVLQALRYPYVLWAHPKKQQIVQIDIPGLKLCFDVEGDYIKSREFPGFVLAKQQYVPFLRRYRSALVLENSSGEKKVLVPEIAWSSIYDSAPEQPYQEKDFYVDEGQCCPTYFLFDIEPGASYPLLTPRLSNQTKIVWLITCYLHQKAYHQAWQLLEETRVTAQPIQKQTHNLLRSVIELSKIRDKHPYAVALRFRLKKWDSTYDQLDVIAYCDLENHMGKCFLGTQQAPKRPTYALTNESRYRGYAHTNQEVLFPYKLRAAMCDKGRHTTKLQLPHALIAPGEDFICNFLCYHQLRKTGTQEEQRQMKVLAYFAYQDTDPLISTLGCILWFDDKTDLAPLFALRDEAAFTTAFDSYFQKIEKPTLSYPRLYDAPLAIHRKGSRPPSTLATHVSQEERFAPLPPMTFSPIAYQPQTSLKQKVGDPVLYEWASAQKAKATEEPVKRQFERLMRGTTEQEEELPIIQPPSLGVPLDVLKAKEQAILALANNWHDKSRLLWDHGRGLRRELDIETLLISLGRKDLSAIQQSNPSLSPDEMHQLMQQLLEYACMMTEGALRAYDPAKRPELAVFEALSGYILRKDQITALDALHTGAMLLEARTGFGKSKVLLPLWLLLTAQEGLTFFLCPATLFDDQERYLQRILKKSYHFFATTIEFSRNSAASVEDIDYILKELERAETLKIPVFMSDRTAHNLFLLKVKELSQGGGGAFDKLLALRRYVRKAKVFVDEPHKVLDDRQEFNYALGGAQEIPEMRRHATVHLYQKLFDRIEGKYQLECWSPERTLTEEIYRSEILPQLAGENASPYLLGQLAPEAQRQYERALTDPSIRCLHDQLHYFLPQSLMHNCGEHYALNAERIAIPLEGARHPRRDNEYVSIDQILNFTIQANLKQPFSLEAITTYVRKLAKEASEEAEQTGLALTKTHAYRAFRELVHDMQPPLPGLLSLQPEQIARLCSFINSHLPTKLRFIEKEILPRICHFEEKVSSSPHLLCSCFASTVGASGTLSMEHFPIHCQVQTDERAMAKTISVLLSKKTPVIEWSEEDALIHLHTRFPEISVILEVGASLRHYPSLEAIGNTLLDQYTSYDGVATFDASGQIIVMPRTLRQWMPEATAACSQLFWFFGQKDTTGRDVTLPADAKAVVMVNRHTTLTHFIQGVGRMRGILAEQQVRVIVDQESAQAIRLVIGKATGDLTLLDLIGYFAIREGEENGQANFRSLSLQLDALLEKQLWDQILSGTVDPKGLRQAIVQPTKDEPLVRPSFEPTPLAPALESLLHRFNKQVDALRLEQGSLLKSQGNAIRDRMCYPRKVYTAHAFGTSQQVEVTTEQTVIQEAKSTVVEESKVIAQAEGVSYAWQGQGHEPVTRTSVIVPIPVARVFSHAQLATYQPLFKSPLYISQNALCTFVGDAPERPGFVNGYIKPLHYLVEGHDGSYVVIDTQEAEAILACPSSVKWLYLLSQGFLIGSGSLPPGLETTLHLLNGTLPDSYANDPLAKAWIAQTRSFRSM